MSRRAPGSRPSFSRESLNVTTSLPCIQKGSDIIHERPLTDCSHHRGSCSHMGLGTPLDRKMPASSLFTYSLYSQVMSGSGDAVNTSRCSIKPHSYLQFRVPNGSQDHALSTSCYFLSGVRRPHVTTCIRSPGSSQSLLYYSSSIPESLLTRPTQIPTRISRHGKNISASPHHQVGRTPSSCIRGHHVVPHPQ